jgi:prepilin-type processing-associated H-X9-DG protein
MCSRSILMVACAVAISMNAPLRAQEKKAGPLERVPLAAARAKSQNNLKQIALAFHVFHDANGAFPRDITDKNGKPLLSWRVAVLPYIEQAALYQKFKLDEPWDSANNKPLAEMNIQPYLDPRGKATKGFTVYQSFSGTGALMSGKALKFNQITDGTSNTFMVVEAGEAVPWSKPADVAFDAKKPLPKLGGIFDGDFNVAFCDGSVRFVKKGVKDEILKNYITTAGAEALGRNDLEPAK